MLRITGSRSRLVRATLPPDGPTRRRPDIAVARRELHWKPRVALREGLAEPVRHFRHVRGLTPRRTSLPAAARGEAARQTVRERARESAMPRASASTPRGKGSAPK